MLWLGLAAAPTTFLFTEGGLVAAMCQIDLPLVVLPLIALLTRIDRRLTEAAEIAGAGPWRVLLTILLPISLPGLLAGWILVYASTSASYVTQAVIGGARHVYVPQLIYREVGILFDWPMASAIAVVVVLSTGCVLLALVGRHPRLAAHA